MYYPQSNAEANDLYARESKRDHERKLRLRVRPATLKQANQWIEKLHRHHKPVVGHRFSLFCQDEHGEIHGCAVVGRPVARELNQYTIAEVTRLVTDGTYNACSILYAACARAAMAMGFDMIQSYILEDEPGTSLKAAGWELDGMTAGGDWNHSWRKGRRTDQPMTKKQRWRKVLNPTVTWATPNAAGVMERT